MAIFSLSRILANIRIDLHEYFSFVLEGKYLVQCKKKSLCRKLRKRPVILGVGISRTLGPHCNQTFIRQLNLSLYTELSLKLPTFSNILDLRSMHTSGKPSTYIFAEPVTSDVILALIQHVNKKIIFSMLYYFFNTLNYPNR